MDTTTYQKFPRRDIRKFKEERIDIMIGTQMVKGPWFSKCYTCKCVLAGWHASLNLGDYRATEKTFQLLLRWPGGAGRGDIPGRVIIQAYNIDDYSIIAASNHDFLSFYNKEIVIRKQTKVPPFTQIASVILSGGNDKAVFESLKNSNKMLKEAFRKVEK